MTEEKTNRVKGRLKLSNSKLNTLLDITNAINNNLSEEKLFFILKNVLIKDLQIGKFVMYTLDESWQVAMTESISDKEASEIDIKGLSERYKSIDVLNQDKDKVLVDFDIIVPVFHNNRVVAYLLLADFEGEKIEISPIIKHLRFIQTVANIIVVALENKKLNKEYINQIEVKKELELAQSMQSLLFPRTLPNDKKLKVTAYYAPHKEVGGDYYDVIQLKDGRTAFCIADVSGKGMSAALLMANFQANLRALLSVTSDIESLVVECNNKVIESANFQKFITLFVAIHDPEKNTLTYLNAGHQPALLKTGNTFKELQIGCTVLGMFEELPKIESETLQLNTDSKLICFTDGLTELEDEKGNQLETKGLIELIQSKKSLKEIENAIHQKISELQYSSRLQDDITLLFVDFLQ